MTTLTMTLLRVAAVSGGVITIVTIAQPSFWLGAVMIVASFAATLVGSLLQGAPKTGYR